MSENITKWRKAHHAALAELFKVADGLAVWRKLVKIELQLHQSAEDYCNGLIDSDAWEAIKDSQERIIARISSTGKMPKGVFINGDPRGYALKLDDKRAKKFPGLHRDWGGYGCLAAIIDEPETNGKDSLPPDSAKGWSRLEADIEQAETISQQHNEQDAERFDGLS